MSQVSYNFSQLKKLNELNAILNVPLDLQMLRRYEYLNSFAIISFDPTVENANANFEYLVRDMYRASDIENIFEDDTTISAAIQNDLPNVWIIVKDKDNEYAMLSTSLITLSGDFVAGPFFSLSAVNETLDALSAISNI